MFIDFFTANLLQSVVVKEFWKSVSISQSYRQKYSGIFFPDTVYNAACFSLAVESTNLFHMTDLHCDALCRVAHTIKRNCAHDNNKYEFPRDWVLVAAAAAAIQRADASDIFVLNIISVLTFILFANDNFCFIYSSRSTNHRLRGYVLCGVCLSFFLFVCLSVSNFMWKLLIIWTWKFYNRCICG